MKTVKAKLIKAGFDLHELASEAEMTLDGDVLQETSKSIVVRFRDIHDLNEFVDMADSYGTSFDINRSTKTVKVFAKTKKSVKAKLVVTAGTEAKQAFEHEIMPWLKKQLYDHFVKNADEPMLEMLHDGKWPEPRMEYGVMRYQPNSMRADKFLEAVVSEYEKWAKDIKKAIR